MTKRKKQLGSESGNGRFIRLAELLVALVTIAVWFVAILLVAAGLGWVMHVLHAHAPWMPGWMFKLGHFVEGFLFVADIFSLVFAVAKELWEHFLDDVVHSVKAMFEKSEE